MLGVGPAATTAEIRAAYRRLAMELHPDRVAGRAPAEQAVAAARMAEVNDAAAVLVDPVRRRTYDTARTTPTASPGAPPAGPGADVAGRAQMEHGHPAAASLAGFLPWVALLAVLAAIFLFTAFAGGPGGDEERDTPPGTEVVRDLRGSCIQVAGGFNLVVNCGVAPNVGEIVVQGAIGVTCPAGTQPYPVAQEDVLACVDPTTAVGP